MSEEREEAVAVKGAERGFGREDEGHWSDRERVTKETRRSGGNCRKVLR